MGGIASGIGGLLGGIFGGNQQAAADTGEASYLGNQAQGYDGSLIKAAQGTYQPINSAAGQGYLGLANSADGALPNSFSALEGYASNPNGTNLSKTGGTVLGQQLGQASAGYGPAYTSFMANEAANGLSPQSIGADINTVKAADTQAINSQRNATGAMTPNIAGQQGDALNSSLQNIAGAGATILGQNQQVQQEGAQGLAQNEAFKQQSGEAATQTASGMDAQTLAYLEQAFQLPAGTLSSAAGFGQEGYNVGNTGASGLAQAAGGYSKAAGAIPNPFTSLGQIGAGIATGGLGGLFGGASTAVADPPVLY